MARKDGWQKTWSTKKGKGIQTKKNRKTGDVMSRSYNRHRTSKSDYPHRTDNKTSGKWHKSKSAKDPHRYGSKEERFTGGLVSAVINFFK